MCTSRMSIRRVHRRETFTLSTENLAHLHKMIPIEYMYEPAKPYTSRPIALSKHRPKRVWPQNFDVLKNSPQKGLIFVWPQRRSCRKEEYTVYVKIVSHMLYWLDQLALFPRGSGVPSEQPPWNINQPLPKPENRDYIIEPDWNSIYAQ